MWTSSGSRRRTYSRRRGRLGGAVEGCCDRSSHRFKGGNLGGRCCNRQNGSGVACAVRLGKRGEREDRQGQTGEDEVVHVVNEVLGS